MIFDWFQIHVVYSNIFWQSNMEVGHKTNNHCLITGGFFSPFVVESLNIPTGNGGFSALKITSLRTISCFSKPLFFTMDLGHRIPFHSRVFTVSKSKRRAIVELRTEHQPRKCQWNYRCTSGREQPSGAPTTFHILLEPISGYVRADHIQFGK